MLEKTIEKQLTQATKQHGGLCIKITSPSHRGMPDRLIILPGGHTAFIELKQPGKHPTPQQQHRHTQLTQLGFPTHVINHPNQIQPTLNKILHTPPIPNTSNQPHH